MFKKKDGKRDDGKKMGKMDGKGKGMALVIVAKPKKGGKKGCK